MTEIVMISIGKLIVSKNNVRKSPGDIDELANSIEQVGVLEPLIVRHVGRKIEVIAGTRRLAAARKIKLKSIPCIVKEMDDDTAMIVSLAENIQRGNLDDEEVEVMVVSTDRDKFLVPPFISENGYDFPVYYADGLNSAFGVKGIPTLFVIDKQGMIRYKKVGFSEGEEFEKIMSWYIDEIKAAKDA